MSAKAAPEGSLSSTDHPITVVISGIFELKPNNGNPVEFNVSACYTSGNIVSIVFSNDRGAAITDIVGIFVADTSTLPNALKEVIINKFSVGYISDAEGSEFTVKLMGTIDGAPTRIKYNSGQSLSTISASLLLGGVHHFDVYYQSNANFNYTIGLYQLKKKVKLNEFINSILASNIELPSIEINNLSVFYLKVAQKASSPERYLLGFRIKIKSDEILRSLPVIGDIVATYQPFKLNEIIVVYAAFEQNDDNGNPFREKDSVKSIFSNMLKISSAGIEIEALEPGINFFTDLTTEMQPLDFKINDDRQGNQAVAPNPAVFSQQDAATSSDTAPVPKKEVIKATSADGVTWTEVNFSKLGIELKRVGYRADLTKQSINFYIDANVSLSILNFQVRGLGFGFKIGSIFDLLPDFTFTGLGISLKKGPIEISGALLKEEIKISATNNRGQPLEIRAKGYSGTIIFQLSSFRIVGIGTYVSYKDFVELEKSGNYVEVTKTSLFIYGVYIGSLGGVPMFFVTGIAAGFGYNRTVRIPAIEKVREFPLVSAVIKPNDKKTPMDMLDDLVSNDLIPVSEGDYWLAVGIKFSTYEILESFILLIVLFGKRLEFVIIGLSVLKLPKESSHPVAYIELVIMARYSPDSDVISIQGMITPASWVFSQHCRIGGGFAFFTWIKGPHAGDFVITIGGYHPRFKKPAHYPTVDRLWLNWQITEEVSIKGEMYYAVTSTCIMAGGKWQLSYNGNSIQAVLVIWADMLIAWAPFYYDIELGVIIKVSANVKILLARININVELMAALRIWGPPFTGKATVSWSVVSFEINFGGAPAEPLQYTFSEYVNAFLPGAVKAGKIVTVVPVAITVEDGIIEIYKTKAGGKTIENYIVNAASLKIKLDSIVPITNYMNSDQHPSVSGVGILPVGVNDIDSNLVFTIHRYNENKKTWEVCYGHNHPIDKDQYDYKSITYKDSLDSGKVSNTFIAGHFYFKEFEKKHPASLWGNETDRDKLAEPVFVEACGGILLEVKKSHSNVPSPNKLASEPIDANDKIEIKNKSTYDAAKETEETYTAQLKKMGNYQGEYSKIDPLLTDWINYEDTAINDVSKEIRGKLNWALDLQQRPLFCEIGKIPNKK